MTSSKSRASISRVAALVVFVIAMLAMTNVAEAGRKRLVVLAFEGPKAAQFQADLVTLLKKSHTVLSTSKWDTAADELDASKVTEKNVKKVAKKLKIDGVVEGKIEKRRDEYIVKLKLRGKDGEVLATVSTKAEGTHLDGSAMKDVKDELLPQIESLVANRGGGGSSDEDEDTAAAPPPKKTKKDPPKKHDDADDDADADPDADAPKKKKGFSKKHPVKGDDAADEDSDAPPPKKTKKDPPPKKDPPKKHDDDDDSPIAKTKAPKKPDKPDKDDDETTSDEPKKPKKPKKVAKTDDDGNVIEDTSEQGGGDEGEAGAENLSPGERAVDLVGGLSFMARRMGFTYSADLGKPPPGYKGVPVGGALVDATIYPGAISHKRDDMLKNLGLTVMVDKVLKISSKVNLNGAVTTLDTSELHYAFGAVFRYPFNKTATSPVIGGSLRYGGQSFTVAQSATQPDAIPPNVAYKIIDPEVFFKYPASDKLTLNVSLGYLLIMSAGDISGMASYGGGSVNGFEGEVSGDYMITKNVFARAAFRFETIGFSFNGSGMQSTGRDADPAQDVFGARDTYVGGAVTVGYAY